MRFKIEANEIQGRQIPEALFTGGLLMFYKMIEKARERWCASQNCTVTDLVAYMTHQGHLRDAQIEAIKTYLYLKIACG